MQLLTSYESNSSPPDRYSIIMKMSVGVSEHFIQLDNVRMTKQLQYLYLSSNKERERTAMKREKG